MADPDSRLTGFRRWLAAVIEPRPDPGEAWCIGCALNGGRTLVVSADEFRDHAAEPHGGARVSIQATWPPGEPEVAEDAP